MIPQSPGAIAFGVSLRSGCQRLRSLCMRTIAGGTG